MSSPYKTCKIKHNVKHEDYVLYKEHKLSKYELFIDLGMKQQIYLIPILIKFFFLFFNLISFYNCV